MISRTRRSHVVPKFYLNGFAEPDSQRVWVGDIATQKTYLADTKKVGVEKDVYADDAHNLGESLEERLARIEGSAAPRLRAFTGGSTQISPELGRFIAWLAARTNWLRRVTQKTLPEYLRDEPQIFQDASGIEKHPFKVVHVETGAVEHLPLEQTLSRVHDPMWQLQVTQAQHLDMLRMQAYLFQEHFGLLKWFKLTAPAGLYFITSDRPVCWDFPNGGASDSPAALRHPEVELVFAMDRSHALIAGHDPIALSARPKHVTEINARIRSCAERFIYGCQSDDVLMAGENSVSKDGRTISK